MSPTTRAPAVAGFFYPASKDELGSQVDALLAGARPYEATPTAKVIIAPHAGYMYSGEIAATAFARLVRDGASVHTVIVMGPAHRVRVRGLAGPGVTQMGTPLGTVEVDATAFARVPQVAQLPVAHAKEHSVEVELPFVQRVAPNARVVPLVVGDASAEEVAAVLRALWGDAGTRIVISSDLSHFHPYDEGRARDQRTASRITALDLAPLDGEDACGAAAINGLLLVARERGLRAELLDLRSSGDTAGTRSEVVGYGAFAFHEAAS